MGLKNEVGGCASPFFCWPWPVAVSGSTRACPTGDTRTDVDIGFVAAFALGFDLMRICP